MADLRPQYSEEVVGHGHPTKADVTSRAWNVEHKEDGTHKDDIIIADYLATDAVETDKIKADAVDDTKIGDAKIKKEHINTDIRGPGLAGGAGTALSVDGIVEVGASVELKCKVIDIGNWDMDALASKDIAHGLTYTDIRSVTVMIRSDGGSLYPLYQAGITGNAVDGHFSVEAAGSDIALYRVTGGSFDGNIFDSDPFNRGFITIWYVA